ncbi:MAG: energy transducer TonB [Bacteroidota bacterium]
MRVSRETTAGWITSLMLHGALLLLFLLVSIPEVVENQDFIEVSWGSPAVSTPAPQTLTETASRSSDVSPSVSANEKKEELKKPSQPVFLPERRISNPAEEVLTTPRSEKLEVSERGTTSGTVERGSVGDRETRTGTSLGDRDQSGLPGTTAGTSLTPSSGISGPGGDLEKGVSFSIQWMQGGTRRKLSGDLPKYPAGTNVEAQIKILTVVLPDGSVKSTQPAQKANTAMEDAAMKEVRFWKFEPLRVSQPQQEQTCVVTFLFTLR